MGLSGRMRPWTLRRFNATVRAYNDYEAFDHSFPHAGGYLDQPLLWLRRVRCALAAKNQADEKRDAEKKDVDGLTGGKGASQRPTFESLRSGGIDVPSASDVGRYGFSP